ncbi:helix-turn-helix domain-containing protein [Lacticaseibacillus sp. N501-2]|uniref:helix-turn-helix domain-containing protein n=1 Tax=Lacticaseibacillus salsurae TaxID=3367729 RepID=UPI0038B36689
MFEQTLRQTRQQRGMTQQQLAERLFVSRQTVSSWETGRNLPNLETLAGLAELLDVSTDYLLGRRTNDVEKQKLACLPTAVAIAVTIRLVISTTAEMLVLSDAMIVSLLVIFGCEHKPIKQRYTQMASFTVGLLMVAFAWGQIFGMDVGNQLAYVVIGALLTSESAWLFCQDRFRLRSGLLKNKAWWITNVVLGALVIGVLLVELLVFLVAKQISRH